MPDDDSDPRASAGSVPDTDGRNRLRRRGWVVGAVALTALTLAAGVTGDRGHAPWQPACADRGPRAA